jgi:hypothetical protein
VLPVVGKHLNLDKKVQEWSLLSLWAQIVDEPFRLKTRAFKIQRNARENILLIHASHPAVAAELSFYLEKYQNRLNGYAAETGLTVHRIELRVGG